MVKKIYSYLVIGAVSLFTLVSCDKEDEGIDKYSTFVDVGVTPYEKLDLNVVFSTDEGKTFGYPKINVGQKYWAKIVDSGHDDALVGTTQCTTVDWSKSKPAPATAIGDVAEFVMSGNNEIIATLSPQYVAYNNSEWEGLYSAVEVYGPDDDYGPYDVQLVQDETNPNKFYIDNFWDSGISAYIVLEPSTNYETQIATFPTQDDGDGGEITGEGMYDTCTGTLSITTNYSGYTWTYNFVREAGE